MKTRRKSRFVNENGQSQGLKIFNLHVHLYMYMYLGEILESCPIIWEIRNMCAPSFQTPRSYSHVTCQTFTSVI